MFLIPVRTPMPNPFGSSLSFSTSGERGIDGKTRQGTSIAGIEVKYVKLITGRPSPAIAPGWSRAQLAAFLVAASVRTGFLITLTSL